MMFIILF